MLTETELNYLITRFKLVAWLRVCSMKHDLNRHFKDDWIIYIYNHFGDMDILNVQIELIIFWKLECILQKVVPKCETFGS